MKNTPASRHLGGLVLALLSVILISSCANSSPESRIARNPQLFNDLSAKDRVLVQRGVIREGMTKNAVFLSWGTPDQTTVGRKSGREIEQWTYLGQRPVRTVSMNVGYGFGGGFGGYGCGPWGYGGGPYGGFGPWGFGGPGMMSNIIYVPYTAGTVSFRSGRVSEWTAAVR